MNDLRHDPDAPDTLNPVAARTAYLRQWQPVPPGVKPWGRTVMHHDGNTYTNVDPPEPPAKWQGSTQDDTPPEPPAPDLRTVGERVAECEQAIAALWDETGSESWNMRQLLGRVEALEVLTERLVARCDALFSAIDRYGMLGQIKAQRTVNEMILAEYEDRIRYLETMVHRLLNPGEQEGE